MRVLLTALHFGVASSDRVDCGNGSTLNDLTAFTVMQWAYPTAQTFNRRFFDKDGKKIGGWDSADVSDIRLIVSRATTNGDARTTGLNLALNTWHFVAFTYDETDGPRVFGGRLDAAASEASYTTRTVGAGGTTADSTGNFVIGNRTTGASNVAFEGRFAWTAAWNRRLTLAEIQAQQFRPFCKSSDGCVGFWHLGWAGTGIQPDLSGNGNNCTVTGATVADHAPLARWP